MATPRAVEIPGQHESVETKIGRSPQGLGLEQFFVLRQKGFGFGPHRSHRLIPVRWFTSNPQPSKNEDWGTHHFKAIQSPGHPPFTRGRFVSYCHERSRQRIKTGNNETNSLTRKPCRVGHPIHLLTWRPGHPPRGKLVVQSPKHGAETESRGRRE